MNIKLSLIAILFTTYLVVNTSAQLPLVYDIENTGASCVKPNLPEPAQLQNYPLLPDPFAWSDGSGRITGFDEWACRRNEIKSEIEEYEIGPKPNRPDTITASYTDGILTVEVTENGETLTLSSTVSLPSGDGPFPVVIGMNSPTGSLPSTLFEGVIQIPFMHNQVVTYSQTSSRNLADPYYKLYPELTYVGNYSAWAWGVSRLIDGLELLSSEINADLKHIALTGCSYAGKMALFSGAYDERIALTIVQESGGGGINAWRVSETIGNVEKIDNTNYSWFMASMKTNFQGRVGKLPHDHHELMAMVAPRALFVLGNPPYVWLGDESGYVSSRATQEVYKMFNIEDRFGFSFRSGHNHCELPSESYPEVQAFVDKFLFGDSTANTDIHEHDFYDTDYNYWIEDWKAPPNPNAPSLTLSGPTSDSAYLAPVTLTFEALVSDANDDVSRVEFLIGNNIIASDTSYPYSFTWTIETAGSYFVSAKAIDDEGLTGYSDGINVIVRLPILNVYNLGSAPIIDGIPDSIWSDERVISFEAKNELVGTDTNEDDLSGSAKVLWDYNNVYILAEIFDDVKRNDSPNTYEDDNVEFYFDSDNSKSSSYDANDVQYSFAWNDGTTIGVLPTGRSSEGISYSIVDTENGYTVEASIPWSTIQGSPENGKELGFDFMINDDDDGGGRDSKFSWNASEDQAWQDATLFGTIRLESAEGVTTKSDVSEMRTLSLYPNPARDILLVQGNDELVEYQIIDLSGQIQLSGKTQNRIQIKNLKQGVYFLKIIDGLKETHLKFIKA